MISRSCALAMIWTAACSGPSLVLDVPPEVRDGHDFMAAIALDGADNPLGFSGIGALDDHVEIALVDDSGFERVDVVAWTRAALPAMSGVDRDDARRTPLTVADRCQAALPRPTAAVRVQGEGTATGGSLDLISAAVPSAACLPGWSRNIAVETRCTNTYCAPAITERGCEADVNLAACGLDTFVVSASAGAPCVSRADGSPASCQAPRTLASGGTELSCTSRVDCVLRFYTTRSTEWATVQRARVLDVQPMVPNDLLVPPIRGYLRFSGYLGAVLALGDEVGVVSRRGAFQNRSACAAGTEADLTWLDDRLVPVRTTTVPGCLGPLVPLPGQARAIAAWVSGAPLELWVGELDPQRGIVRSQRVDTGSIPVTGVTEALLGPDGRVVVSVSVEELADDATGQLALVDPDTLATELLPIPDDNALALEVEGRDVVFAGSTQDIIGWIDIERRLMRGSVGIPSSVSLSDVLVDVPTSRVWMTVPNEDHVIFTFQDRALLDHTQVFEGEWLPLTLMRGGRTGVGRVVVGSVIENRSERTWTAGISRGEPKEDGTRPGIIELGFGVVGQHARTPDGALWATLPWSGEIVRITLTDD